MPYEKLFYTTAEAAQMLSISESTLRYWSGLFDGCEPEEIRPRLRKYRAIQLDRLKLIHKLLRVDGLSIEATQRKLRTRLSELEQKQEVLNRLKGIRSQLLQLIETPENQI